MKTRCSYIASDQVINPSVVARCIKESGHAGSHVFKYPNITASR